MKNSTKNTKAIAEFKATSDLCSTSYIGLADHVTKIGGNEYFCNVTIEDRMCTVYAKSGNFSC